jgi:hypothetical protein
MKDLNKMNERYQALTATIETLEAERDRQQKTEAENFTREFREAMDLFLAVWRDGPLPAHLRSFARSIDELAALWASMAGKPDVPVPCPDWLAPFWRKTINGLLREFKLAQDKAPAVVENLDEQEPEAPFIEPVESLVAQKVSWQQVCEIYGPPLVDEHTGHPSYAKYLKEVKVPGSILGEDANDWGSHAPEHKQHVAAIRRRRELAQRAIDVQQARRQRQLAERSSEQQGGADETPLEQLVAEGVSVKQIGRMKGVSVAEIERQCKAEGLTPQRSYSLAADPNPDLPADIREARQRVTAGAFQPFQDRAAARTAEVEIGTSSRPTAVVSTDLANKFGGDPDALDYGDDLDSEGD